MNQTSSQATTVPAPGPARADRDLVVCAPASLRAISCTASMR